MVPAMRPSLSRFLVAAALTAGLAAAPAVEAQTRRPPAKPAPTAPPPPPYVPQERITTPDDVKSGSVGGAVTTPLRDLGMQKTDIPDVLLQALTDPYARPPRRYNCRYLISLVRPLDDALGPDMDLLPAGDEDLLKRGKSGVLGTAADVASSALIPFRGVVRKISGAESHERLVHSAIVAGNVRRAYLKGLGEAKGCNPPATPSHERAGATPAKVDKGFKPRFPTR
jgi:hypothetical protein